MKVLRRAPTVALALFLVLPALAQTLERAKQLPSVNLMQLAAGPQIQGPPREKTHRKVPVRYSGFVAPPMRGDRPVVQTTPSIAAPPIVAGFKSDTSRMYAPADASGAVGKNHVVGVSNAGIAIQSRSGAVLAKVTLETFWQAAPGIIDVYDPRVAYDAAHDRWVTVALQDDVILGLAVSQTGDPTGTWTRYTMGSVDLDFTRLAITKGSVIVSVNRVSIQQTQLFSFQKSEIYASVPAPNVTKVVHHRDVVPVPSPDSTSEYIVASDNGYLYVKRMNGPEEWRYIAADYQWSGAWMFAPQRGSNRELDCGFGYIEAAEFRGGWLHVVQTVTLPSGPERTSIAWWRLDPVREGYVEVGIIDDPATPTYYAYPSLAVNRSGGMLIAYSRLSHNEYPSTAFMYRNPAGQWSSERLIKAGDSPIHTTDRWGDYTTTMVDPADNTSFWTIQVYAASNVWATWWANVKIAPGRTRAVRH